MDDFFMIMFFLDKPALLRQDAAVNVNVWLAPDRACRKGGGLNIYKSSALKQQPKRQKQALM